MPKADQPLTGLVLAMLVGRRPCQQELVILRLEIAILVMNLCSAVARFRLRTGNAGLVAVLAADNQESGDHAVGLAVSEVRGVVKRVFAQQDVLDACARRDLGVIITILGAHGVTQGQIAELTGISQGRLSEWARHKRSPAASSTFEAFADSLAVPSAARRALGLAPVSSLSAPAGSGPGPGHFPGGRATPSAEMRPGRARLPAAGLPGLQGLEMVWSQLDVVIAVLEAEQVRRKYGSAVRRSTWKNLVFTGPPGSGKSRTAIAVGQAYRKLGVLSDGRVLQVAAADLVGAGPEERASSWAGQPGWQAAGS